MLFAIAVVAVALRMPRGFATSLFYIPLILCGLTFRRPTTTFLLAGAAGTFQDQIDRAIC